MRILSLDSGAKRCGISIVDDGPILVHSEIFGVVRGEKTYQDHRLDIIDKFGSQAEALLLKYQPNFVVAETIPVISSSSFASGGQSALASTASTAFLTIASQMGFMCQQIAASSVKKILTGKGRASKVLIRNFVLETFPELLERKGDFKTIFDETDAIAISLAYGKKTLGWKI
jgi:Holliday junction resolvasome RuvABC endonuclease subunit